MPFSDLDDAPVVTKPQYFSDQSKLVPPGKYDVELLAGQLKETTSGDVFTFVGMILTDCPHKTWHLERTIFFAKKTGTAEEKSAYRKQKYDELIKDLTTLGFDTENWTTANGRPRSEQIPLAAAACKGLRAEFVKKGPREEGGVANVYLNKRLAAADGRAPKLGAGDMVAGEQGAASPLSESVSDKPHNAPTDGNSQVPW